MRRTSALAWIVLGQLLLAPAVFAGNPFYLTGKLGDTGLELDLSDSVSQIIDGNDNSWSVGIGFKLGKFLAVQGEVYDFGTQAATASVCGSGDLECLALFPEGRLVVPVEADSSAISISALARLPLGDRFSIYGKFGIVSWESDVSEILDAGDRILELDDEEILYGAGVRFELPGPFGVFGEYERISDTFETVSLGATLGFQ